MCNHTVALINNLTDHRLLVSLPNLNKADLVPVSFKNKINPRFGLLCLCLYYIVGRCRMFKVV